MDLRDKHYGAVACSAVNAENDVSMFRVVGASFAMGQAKDDVKAAATAVTLSNEEDGVASAIRRILSGEFD